MFYSRRPSLEQLQDLIWTGRYAIKAHAVRHAISEGFTERDIVTSLERGRELAVYPEDSRMLVLGYIHVSQTLRLPLHVVIEFSHNFLDVVTAYIPDDPYRIVSRERVAILIEHGPRTTRERLHEPHAKPKARPRAARAWRARHAG